uniref:DUF2187 domain-containing protein n=1 Tax=Rhabditophanes sp. KR3021 TaxID=114890 RepID=A0AC35TP33_9BILA
MTKEGIMKGIRYVGETVDFDGRMCTHKTRYNLAVELQMLFDKEEDFIKEIVYDKSFGKNEVIVLKKWHQSKEAAGVS